MNTNKFESWVQKDGIACAAICKNGNTSIRNTVGYSLSYTNETVLQFDRRIAFFRDPLDRLVSGYSFFYFKHQVNPSIIRNRITEDAISSWEKYVDYILEHNDNHWIPQSTLLMCDGEYVPTETYKLSDMDDVWIKIWPGIYPWRANRIMHLPYDPEYRKSDIESVYRKDFEIWHSL